MVAKFAHKSSNDQRCRILIPDVAGWFVAVTSVWVLLLLNASTHEWLQIKNVKNLRTRKFAQTYPELPKTQLSNAAWKQALEPTREGGSKVRTSSAQINYCVTRKDELLTCQRVFKPVQVAVPEFHTNKHRLDPTVRRYETDR